jgi:hypothetical protein
MVLAMLDRPLDDRVVGVVAVLVAGLVAVLVAMSLPR